MRKINDIGKRTALAGVGTAISLVFVTLAFFVKNLSLSFYVLSATGVMLPLCLDYYREGFLTAIAVTVAGFFIANVAVVPFAMASGFYVVFSIFWYNKKFNRWLGYLIKAAYACLVFFVLYKVTALLAVDFSSLPKIQALPFWAIYIILNVLFVLCFIVYDILLEQGYVYLKKLLKKVVKKN